MAALVGSVFLPVLGQAQVLLSDNFDGYADQAAFQTAWPVITGTGGTLSTTQAVSGAFSVNYPLTAQRNGRSFTESGNPSASASITFSFNFYDSDVAASPYRMYGTILDGAASASGQLISLGLNNNLTSAAQGGNFYMARILGYTPPGQAAGDFFKLNDNPLLLRTTGWHNLSVTITDTAFNFYVDGSLAETVANTLTLRSYDSVRLGSGVSSTREAFFDNVSVTVNAVPEPTTGALIALGLSGLLVLRRQRN